jgi:DNA polymerase-1
MKNKYAELLANISNEPREELDSVLIIDGLNTFLRAFTMINHINPEGHHIGGLTGFLKSVGYAIKMFDPTKVVIVFDGVGGSNNRKNLYPGYKANRNTSRMTNYAIFTSKEDEVEAINSQMARLIHYLQCLPVSMICIDGIEADDTIGYLAAKLNKFSSNKEVTIMSADRDFLQLVNNKIQVYSPTKKKVYKPKDVLEEFEVTASNYINYKILMGDKSDNIPGVLGLGPKKLLKLFPDLATDKILTLKDILAVSADKINEHKLYANIIEREKQLGINSQLMDLSTVPISHEDINQIQKDFISRYELNSYNFMNMYFNDKLGESIPNTQGWLTQVFGPLKF